ncbi:hypothetical protein SKAU_G00244580 [Synaphobranchus kaupii]|uniref:Uncharacterized protein n=1 Tax=Synaphobranchus kaupii TaxID=118154 RepID=A0A9Q1IR23_SYNKA|nr:hypothetical protein SKAU_G00244580 [Synaphobranchus kaupii]
MKENAAIITGKQEVLNTLLQTQQLLVDQTEALSRAEQELSVRSEEHWIKAAALVLVGRGRRRAARVPRQISRPPPRRPRQPPRRPRQPPRRSRPPPRCSPPTAMALPPTTTALPPTIMAFPPPASPHSLRGGAPAAHAADALAAIVGQERGSRQLQSHSSVRSPVYSVPDNGSSPSHNMCQEGGFNSEPGGPAGVPAHHLDCDPTGGGRQGRKQDEKASIPKTAIQTTNKDGRGSQESAGSEHAGRGETAASEVHLNQGQPGFLETNHSGAPQKPTEHHGGMLENKAKSDINPFSSQAEQDSMLASDDQTVMDKSQLTPTGDVSSTNKAWGHACSPAMGRACDVDLNAKPDTSSVGVRALSHHSDPMANRISGPEFESTVTTSGASEPKSADRAEEKFEGRTSFERRENAPTKESSSVTRPRTEDTPDTLDVESVPPESSGPDPSQHREGKGKQPHEETSGAPAPGNKRFRSSFELELLTKAKGSPCHFLGFVSQMKGDQTNDQISRSLTPSKPSFLKTKTQLRPGFQGFLSSITVSMLQKDKPISRGKDF